MALSQEAVQLTPQQEVVVTAFLKEFPQASRATAIKFCFGRKFEVNRVFPLYEAYQKIIKERQLENLSAADVLQEMRTAKMYIPGSRDLKGAALFVVKAANHIPGQFPKESTIKLAYYLGEVVTSNIKTQRNGLTLLIDLDGMDMASFDATFMAEVINFFQNHIPAAVKNILIWHAPWWIRSAIQIVSPFLKEKMRKRIHLCDNMFALQQFIAQDQLPVDFGGTFDYDHESFVHRQLSKASTDDVLTTLTAEASKSFSEQEKGQAFIGIRPNAKLLVPAEDEEELQKEREALLQNIGENLAKIQESQKDYTGYPMPVYNILYNRTCRLTLDSAAYYQPFAAIVRSGRRSSVEAVWNQVRNEADENAKIVRIKEAIIKDQREYSRISK